MLGGVALSSIEAAPLPKEGVAASPSVAEASIHTGLLAFLSGVHCDEHDLQPPADVDVDGCDCPELLNHERLDCSIGLPHVACSIISTPGRPIS